MKVYTIPYYEMTKWPADFCRDFWLNLCEWCRQNLGEEGKDWRLQSGVTATIGQNQIDPGVIILNGKELTDELITDMFVYAKLGLQLF